MNDITKFQNLINEIDELIAIKSKSSDSKFEAWQIQVEKSLIKIFNKDSIEYKNFSEISFTPGVWSSNTDEWDEEDIEYCKKGLEKCKVILTSFLETINENNLCSKTEKNFNKVFIVHGHDETLKLSVARAIEKQGLEAIILSEQSNRGQTIIEKFESNSNVGGAVCLFTADDLGRSKKTQEDKFRARQNVVFEAGYFIGKLGRSNVILLVSDEVEVPSDLSGVVYTNDKNWQFEMLKELKLMGYSIDLNKY